MFVHGKGVIVDIEIWHKHIGHMKIKVLAMMPKLLSSISELMCCGDCPNKPQWRAQPPMLLLYESHQSCNHARLSLCCPRILCMMHSTRGEKERGKEKRRGNYEHSEGEYIIIAM